MRANLLLLDSLVSLEHTDLRSDEHFTVAYVTLWMWMYHMCDVYAFVMGKLFPVLKSCASYACRLSKQALNEVSCAICVCKISQINGACKGRLIVSYTPKYKRLFLSYTPK